MKPVTIAKLALAGAGVLVFFLGVFWGSAELRWVGTGLVAVAWLMRFVKDAPPPAPPSADA